MQFDFSMGLPEKVINELKEKPVYIEITILGITFLLFSIVLKPTFMFYFGFLEAYFVAVSDKVNTDELDNYLVNQGYKIEFDDEGFEEIDEEKCEVCEDREECMFYNSYLESKKEK